MRDPATGAARGAMIDYFGRHRRLRATAARPELERYLDHEQDWVRQDARRALAKLPPARAE